jgi:hypothetical protein
LDDGASLGHPIVEAVVHGKEGIFLGHLHDDHLDDVLLHMTLNSLSHHFHFLPAHRLGYMKSE